MLLPAFKLLLERLLTKVESVPLLQNNISIVDSFPIVVAKEKRSFRAKVARECCEKGYFAVKDMHYYGLKLHFMNFRCVNFMSVPENFQITAANLHDLTAMREVFLSLYNRTVFVEVIL